MKIQLHRIKRDWYKYLRPKRICKEEPIYKWLFFVIRLNKEEYQEKLYKKTGQSTFIYCPKCNNELISSNSFVKDTDYVYYKCSNCGYESKWDFDFLTPILIDNKEKEGNINDEA